MSSKKEDSKKLCNYTPKDIKNYLNKFRKCILEHEYTISQNENRLENMKFIEDYKINTRKEQEILLGIQYDDFCYAVQNDHPKYSHEILYIFCKQHQLDYWGTRKDIDIYIKINMIEKRDGDIFSIVVSFHKRNFKIAYVFR